MTLKTYPLGNEAVVISFGDTIDTHIHDQVVESYQRVQQAKLEVVTDLVPTYRTLAVYYDWRMTSYRDMKATLERLLLSDRMSPETSERRIIHLPVCYESEEFAPDLHTLADYHDVSVSTVIERHINPLYRVYMIGFLPGFPYLGGLDSRLQTPRLSEPRSQVPAGSVGIAGGQTGIYPVESPGGWQIIGRTPFALFNPNHEQPTLFRMGDWLTFNPISLERYDQLKQDGNINDFIEEA
ncbi:inhibitor of KinA [Alkalibacillus flavidus]|uniref:Inhibitor of KinA n=1 Tax=Alkalibacillus flavidus TaxID=546021 RepID=A0ABV2KX27_9BACI